MKYREEAQISGNYRNYRQKMWILKNLDENFRRDFILEHANCREDQVITVITDTKCHYWKITGELARKYRKS